MEKIEILKTPDFLSGGGEMGERIRNFDWSKNPLGDPKYWEQSLKTCVRIMLSSSQPIWIGWGKELIKLYNDAYIDIVRGKHPLALGQPASVVWKDIWKDIEPLLAKAMIEDEGTYVESQLLIMERSGYPEETYYTFSYTPVLGDDGNPAGIICYNVADAERIISERSLKTLQQLDTIAQKKTEQEVYEQTSKALETNNKDFPFALIYKIENEGRTATTVAWIGVEKDHPEIAVQIDLQTPGIKSNNISKAVAENKIVESINDGRWKNLPKGAWDVMPQRFVHVPVKTPNKKFPLAVLTIGLNPYRQFDDVYKNFVQLIADRISLGVNNVIAYEEERKRVEALEELDKAKTIFFSNISHEFRTPLTLMLGTIEEALNDSNNTAGNIERMTITHRNAMRLLKLVNTLLDFSRIESGRQKANYSLTDIASLTKNLAGNFRSIIEKAGLKFLVKADSIIQPVYVDRQMWEKIVFNLLSNAFKYTLNGNITVKLFSENNHAVLEIGDTGVGIPEKELPHMFERFHRVQNATGRTYEGTGIGLSLIKELVHLHGGTIGVKSTEGKGSVFTVAIPFGKGHLPADQTSETIEDLEDMISAAYIEEANSLLETTGTTSPAAEKDTQLVTILVVDDNADMRQHIRSALQKHFNVLTAANGMEALHKIRSGNPSIVLSDIMMPIMDGIQLLKEIKQDKQTAHIPVILLTARAGEESKLEGFETGADDYLVKPFSANELLSRIKAQIDISNRRKEVETRLREFLMQAPAAIAIVEGSEYLFTLANPLFEKIFGTTGKQLTGRTLKEVFPELEGQGIFELLNNVFLTGQPFLQKAFPARLNIDGEIKTGYYDFILQPIRNTNDEITGIMAHVVDTTENVLASKKIEQNAAMIRNMYMNAPAFIAVFKGPEHVYELVNPYYQLLIGERNVIGKKLLEALPELKGQGIDTLFDRVYNTGETVLDKESLVMLSREAGKEPQETYFDYAFQPAFNEEEKITGVLAFGTEITEQVKARKKIQESEKQFRDVLLYSPNIFVILKGPDMLITFVNDPLLISWGRKWDIVGKTLIEALPELKDQPFPALLDKVYRTGETYYGKEEKAVLIKDGVPADVYYNYVYQPIFESDNTISGITIMATDITEQVITRKKIEESQKELQDLVRQAPIAIVLLEGQNLVARVVNAAALQMMGKKEEELMNKALHEFFPELPNRKNIYGQVLKTGISYSGKDIEVRFKRHNEMYTGYYDLNYTPWYNSDGTIKGVISVAVEVTEKVLARKKIETISAELEVMVKERTAELEKKNTELEETQTMLEQKNNELSKSLNELEILFRKLQEQQLKDEQKDDFILMASHELKTPVTTINGYVQLLIDAAVSAKNNGGIDTVLLEPALKTIHKQIAKLTSLISELLDLSKIQKGQLDLHKTTFDLSELISDVVKDIQYTTQHKIELVINSKDKVFADKDRIMQVVINLITNAIKYSPGAEKLEINVSKQDGNYAAVSVKDYGIGIPGADHKKIFERFYRVEGKKEKTFPGFGIGLFIASDIIKRHNGNITVISEKNNGSTFTFILPL